MLKKIERYRKFRRTVDELSRMDDKNLRDIGISRCDIRRIARETL